MDIEPLTLHHCCAFFVVQWSLAHVWARNDLSCCDVCVCRLMDSDCYTKTTRNLVSTSLLPAPQSSC